ncbi:zinc metalloprotease [Actinoplanes awajinensis]|uniref:Peptidase metallopeptidase domain-containing protein n=1 Tax=Actinoplanes awajinensis subsp. mycoplanecinus TaxID=135947 RepID=A0A0X3UY56_9ACTN|nr:hypothetical protein [Actinoplanes awajinensis]KUL35916.1 hypothetical protein ADL15_14295 [Actinoplanes awajinensis subsp. mycoplanecinus]
MPKTPSGKGGKRPPRKAPEPEPAGEDIQVFDLDDLETPVVTKPRDMPVPEPASKRPARQKATSGPPSVWVDGEAFHRVEGDILLDEDQFHIYREAQRVLQGHRETTLLFEKAGLQTAQVHQYGAATSALVGIVDGGKLVRWAPGTVLRYCVLRQTFPEHEWYTEIVENMLRATEDWAAVCGVDFEYVKKADDSDSLRPPGVVFPVRHIDTGGTFIAAAFFPNDPVSRRRVLIDPSYFSTTGYNRVGVLRHELGHVLGFRHEHTRSGAPQVCPDEDMTGTFDLTAYDPHSVMHYFCGGVGSRALAITEVDRAGSQFLYGPPLNRFQLLKP